MKYGRFLLYALSSGLQLDRWLWILYLSYRGFSLAEVGIAKIVFDVTVLITEVPTGYLADRFGKRYFLIAGGFAAAGSALAFRNASSLPVVLLALVLRALAFTLPSGSDAACLNDAAVKAGDEKDLGKLLGRFASAHSLGQFLGGLAGGGLAEVSWAGLYLVDLAVALGRIVTASLLPTLPANRQAPLSPEHKERSARIQSFLPYLGVLTLVLLASMYWSVSTVKFLFAQSFLDARGVGPGVIAAALSVTDLLSMAGASLGGRLSSRIWRLHNLTWIAAVDAVATGLLVTPALAVNFAALGTSQILIGTSGVVISREILEKAPGHLHATLLSSLGTATSLMSAGGFLLIGTVSGTFGNNAVILSLAGALVALTAASALSQRSWGASHAETEGTGPCSEQP